MKLSDFKIRDKIKCCREGNESGNQFIVRIEDVVDEQKFITDLPIVTGGGFVRFRENTKLDFIYKTEHEIYIFKGEVAKTPALNDKTMEVVLSPSSIKRVQRRNFFRLPFGKQCSIIHFADNFSCEDKSIEAVSVNVSAGGVRLKIDDSSKFQNGDFVFVDLNLSKDVKGCWGNVVEALEVDDNHFVSVEFKYLFQKEIDQLVSFIFDKQREQNRV